MKYVLIILLLCAAFSQAP